MNGTIEKFSKKDRFAFSIDQRNRNAIPFLRELPIVLDVNGISGGALSVKVSQLRH